MTPEQFESVLDDVRAKLNEESRRLENHARVRKHLKIWCCRL